MCAIERTNIASLYDLSIQGEKRKTESVNGVCLLLKRNTRKRVLMASFGIAMHRPEVAERKEKQNACRALTSCFRTDNMKLPAAMLPERRLVRGCCRVRASSTAAVVVVVVAANGEGRRDLHHYILHVRQLRGIVQEDRQEILSGGMVSYRAALLYVKSSTAQQGER